MGWGNVLAVLTILPEGCITVIGAVLIGTVSGILSSALFVLLLLLVLLGSALGCLPDRDDNGLVLLLLLGGIAGGVDISRWLRIGGAVDGKVTLTITLGKFGIIDDSRLVGSGSMGSDVIRRQNSMFNVFTTGTLTAKLRGAVGTTILAKHGMKTVFRESK